MSIGLRVVESVRVMFELVNRDHPLRELKYSRPFNQMLQLENRDLFITECENGVNDAFRVFHVRGKYYGVCDFGFPQFIMDEHNSKLLSSYSIQWEIIRGRRYVGNFLMQDWIKNAYFHRLALFSMSNSFNHPDSWKWFMTGSGGFTFTYPNLYLMRALERVGHDRVKIRIDKKVLYTDTESKQFIDHMIDPTRLMSWAIDHGVQCNLYDYPDLVTVIATDGYTVKPGEYGPFNPLDSYMCAHAYFSTLSPGTRYSDFKNTQTWKVKAASALMRELLKQGPNDQRRLRAIGMKQLSPNIIVVRMSNGFYYGYDPISRTAIDVSGHAFNMMIAAGYGAVDIGRYFDTVRAVTSVALTRGKKDPEYLRLIQEKVLTEDALKNPFKVWHSHADYAAALNAYIDGAKDLGYAINPWVIRIVWKKLREITKAIPEFVDVKRKALDSTVRAVVGRK